MRHDMLKRYILNVMRTMRKYDARKFIPFQKIVLPPKKVTEDFKLCKLILPLIDTVTIVRKKTYKKIHTKKKTIYI